MPIDTIEPRLINSFEEEVKKGIIDPKIIDLSTKKQQQLYQTYINKIISLNPQEYLNKIMPQYKDDFFRIAGYLVVNIFGQEYLEEFNKLIKNKLYINESDLLLDGSNLRRIDPKTNKLIDQVIVIPNFTHLSSIITLLHEFTHYICKKNNISLNKKQYYEEILSLYVEQRAIIILNEILQVQQYTKLIEESRLETIKWHHTTGIEENNEYYRMIEMLRLNSLVNPYSREDFEMMKLSIPQIETPSRMNILKSFYENRRVGYGLGYLFSEYLISKQIDNPLTTDQKIKDTINSRITLEELLKYYDIRTDNQKVYDTVEELKLTKRH